MERTTGSSPPEIARPGSVSWYRPGILLCRPPIEQTETSIRAYYAVIRSAVDEGAGPYVMITDTRQMVAIPDARGRRLHGQLARESIEHHPTRRCVRSITIVRSPAIRAVLTAVRWFLGASNTASEVVGSFEEALRSAQSKE